MIVRGRNEYDEALIYWVEDYNDRKNVGKDLEEGHRVVIISTKDDVLSFYGLILEQFGQYNLYKVDSIDEVNDEYIDYVKDRDQSKEEAILYVGKPLFQLVSECIDELKLTPKQTRMMAIVKEVLKGSNEIKQEATLELLNEKLKREKAEKDNLKAELEQLRTKSEETNLSTEYLRTSLNLNTFLSQTQVMLIKEYNSVPYLKTCLEMYAKYLNEIKRIRAKLVIFDNRLFDIKYKDYKKVDSQQTYLANSPLFMRVEEPVVSYQLFPIFLSDLYQKGSYDVLIILDRILNKTPLVKGKNVHSFVATDNQEILDYLQGLSNQDFTYITSIHMDIDNWINIPKLNNKITNDKEALYWYSRLPNKGNDNRLIYTIFNEKNHIDNIKRI